MLTLEQIEHNKNSILYLLKAVKRDGIEDLIRYLEESDFFTAPASTKYHDSFEGGLVWHTLEVYKKLVKLVDLVGMSDKISKDSLILISLLHDLCKVYTYTKTIKNVKHDENGNWDNSKPWKQIEAYAFNDTLPLGHGEKSVIILQQFIKLTIEEQLAIRWHMMFDSPECADFRGKSSASEAMNQYPLVLLLHTADMFSMYF